MLNRSLTDENAELRRRMEGDDDWGEIARQLMLANLRLTEEVGRLEGVLDRARQAYQEQAGRLNKAVSACTFLETKVTEGEGR